jgi:hypothetical protein
MGNNAHLFFKNILFILCKIICMKNPINLFFCFCFIFVFTNCKKGEEDPEFSMRSRKARLTGDWRLKSGNLGITFLEVGNTITSEDYIFDSKGATIYVTPTSNNLVIYKMAYFLNLNINKDGSFYMEEQAGVDVLKAEGVWNFTSRVGDSKNKDALLFVIEKVSSGATNKHIFNKFISEFSYKLLELSNKEIKFETGTKMYLDGQGNNTSFSGRLTLFQ